MIREFFTTRSSIQQLLVVMLLSLPCAFFVTFDAEISRILPEKIWKTLYIEQSPLKVSLLMPILSVVVIFVVKQINYSSAQYIGLTLIFIAAQTGGLKLGRINGLDIVTFGIFVRGLVLHMKNPDTQLKLSSLFFFALALQGLNLLTLMHQPPVQHVIGAIGLFKMFILAMILTQLINSTESILFATQAIIVIALLSSLIAISQAVLYYIFSIDITFIDQFGGAADTHFKPTPFGMLPRASALNTTAQHLSSFLLIALPFTLFENNEAQLTNEKIFKVLLLLLGVVSTWNFGGIFVAIFLMGIYPYVRWPNYSIHIICGMLIISVLAYFSGVLEWIYLHSFGDSGVSKGVDQRHTLLNIGLETLFRLPLVGEGLRGFADNSSGNYWHRPVHNSYVQAATEIGFVGALVFLGLMLTKLTQLVILMSHSEQNIQLIKAAFSALLGLSLLMFSEPMLDHSNTWILLGVIEALIISSTHLKIANNSNVNIE